MWFNHHGSVDLPPHTARDFIWKDYAPQVFRKLRDAFDEYPGNYIKSICGKLLLCKDGLFEYNLFCKIKYLVVFNLEYKNRHFIFNYLLASVPSNFKLK